jgi:hypothetical protein
MQANGARDLQALSKLGSACDKVVGRLGCLAGRQDSRIPRRRLEPFSEPILRRIRIPRRWN